MPYVDYAANLPAGRDLLPLLLKANDFAVKELVENRRGRISTRQMGKLLIRIVLPLRAAGKAVAAYLLFVLAFRTFAPAASLRLTNALAASSTGAPAVILAAGLAVFTLAALLNTSKKTLQILLDLAFGKAETIQGRAYGSYEQEEGRGLRRLSRDKKTTYYYAIKRDLFEVSPRGHAALPNGELYSIHFAPHSRILLSIEPVALGVRDPKHAEAFSWRGQQAQRAATAR